jgi:hypothetical protein
MRSVERFLAGSGGPMAAGSARFGGMFAVKSADAHLEHVQREGRLRRAIGLFDLLRRGVHVR